MKLKCWTIRKRQFKMNKKRTKPNIQITPKTANQADHLFDNETFIYILLGAVIFFVLIARIHLLSFPFERDEGEYALMGRLILDGHAPYTIAYNMKFPGTYYMYALIMGIFGKSISGVHLGLTFIVLSSIIFMFYIAKNFISKIGAIISAFTFGIVGTSWTLLAQAAHATHFVTFFALLGIASIFWIYNSKRDNVTKYFISGIFFSLAFLCKQSGLFFVFLGFTMIITKEFKPKLLIPLIKKISVYLLGFLIPILIMFCYFYFFSDFEKFWFWTVEYLQKYGNQIPVSDAPGMFKFGLSEITANYSSVGYTAIWIVALIGIPFIFINNKTSRQNKIIIGSFLLFSFLTIIPGFYFRNHYFITLLPVIALLVGVFFEFFNNIFIYRLKFPNLLFISLLAFILLISQGINANKDYLFKTEPRKSCKLIYGTNPFVESIIIADFLKRNSTKDDKIAILGSEPQIYFYADRYPATGYVYTYGLVENHTYSLSMQKEMIKEIENNNPKYMLFVNVKLSWLVRPNSEKHIFYWADQYIKEKYKLIALIDVNPNRSSSLIIGEQLINYKPQSQNTIFIYERTNLN